jgi:hypothetical protein
MPLIDSNTAALWDGGEGSLYRGYTPDGSRIAGYERAMKQQFMGDDVDAFVSALETRGLTRGQRIALVGCGFGWFAERLVELGYGPMADGTANGRICNIDTSTWIHANKNGNAATTIINANVNSATGRRAIRQQFGSNNAEVHWAISEDVLPILIGAGPTPDGNNEIVPFCQSLRALVSTGVAHWVSVYTGGDQDQRLNWKTLEEWKDWVTPDLVVQRGTATVL